MPYVFLLITSFLFGGNFVLGKFLVGHASPATLTSLRWALAVICLLPIIWKREQRLIPPKAALLPLFLMGLTGVAAFNLLQFQALEYTSASNVGLISTLNTISIALFSFLLLKEKINSWQMAAMLLSFSGVLVVLTEGSLSQLLDLRFNKGDLYMMGAVCIWGLYSVCSRWAMQKTSPLMATFFSGAIGVVLLLPFNAADFSITEFNVSFMVSILYTGVVSTVICMVLWNIGVQKLGATEAGLFLNFNPIFTAVLASVFLHEKWSWMQVIGSLVVILGCILFTKLKKPPQLTLKKSAIVINEEKSTNFVHGKK
ncbi:MULTISPECIES: DMT family transporter [Bacillaceae]|uniref:DMT family transporter n=1 Tax=Bacillaceae TaxID=186817 RepID=UPI001E5B6872|nr:MULTISPECIES: DMT family transporter [Bacillaceae]MCE4050603.1 DMT family transporter [Bacillus sp. Au-Bac7]MDL0435998.1 DMT family transporter [Niallia sp. SS-2023]UPO87865.1 DMT family transporter [Niallia sp. Man26]